LVLALLFCERIAVGIEILSRSTRPSVRKPSYREGMRATAVRVPRPLAKKSVANQRKEHRLMWKSTLSGLQRCR